MLGLGIWDKSSRRDSKNIIIKILIVCANSPLIDLTIFSALWYLILQYSVWKLKMPECFLKAADIIKVGIDILFFIRRDQLFHLLATVKIGSFEWLSLHKWLSECFVLSQSKIYKDSFFVTYTVHDILWFDIVMN